MRLITEASRRLSRISVSPKTWLKDFAHLCALTQMVQFVWVLDKSELVPPLCVCVRARARALAITTLRSGV